MTTRTTTAITTTTLKGTESTKVTADDFALTISVEETTIQQDEKFKIDVELRNNTGKDQLITYEILFWPHIPGMIGVDGLIVGPPYPQSTLFEANSVLRNIGVFGVGGVGSGSPWRFGHTLESGIHELRFSASFWLGDDWLTTNKITIWSNTVILTVL